MTARARALLIAGPTAAGKSAIASRLARELGGVVINADSMQVYREWRILTARPTEAECRAVPHRLYGHASIRESYSVGQWLRDLQQTLSELEALGQFPIVAGGTGAYFRALTGGLAEIPPADPAIRRDVEAEIVESGLPAMATALSARDPATADAIDLRNPRRVARAWEVLRQTGLGLAEWRTHTPPPLLPPSETVRVVIAPPRTVIAERISLRFDAMMRGGAMEEAEEVLALGLPQSLPGHASGRRTGAVCLPRGPHPAGGSRRSGQIGYPKIRQAADDLVSQPDAGLVVDRRGRREASGRTPTRPASLSLRERMRPWRSDLLYRFEGTSGSSASLPER